MKYKNVTKMFKTFIAFAVVEKIADKNEMSTCVKTNVCKTKNENSSKTAKLYIKDSNNYLLKKFHVYPSTITMRDLCFFHDH
jgi:hypothetical protein